MSLTEETRGEQETILRACRDDLRALAGLLEEALPASEVLALHAVAGILRVLGMAETALRDLEEWRQRNVFALSVEDYGDIGAIMADLRGLGGERIGPGDQPRPHDAR